MGQGTVAIPRAVGQNVVRCKSLSLREEVLYRKPKGMRIADNRSVLTSGRVALFRTGEVCQLARFRGESVAGYEGDLMAPYSPRASAPTAKTPVPHTQRIPMWSSRAVSPVTSS